MKEKILSILLHFLVNLVICIIVIHIISIFFPSTKGEMTTAIACFTLAFTFDDVRIDKLEKEIEQLKNKQTENELK